MCPWPGGGLEGHPSPTAPGSPPVPPHPLRLPFRAQAEGRYAGHNHQTPAAGPASEESLAAQAETLALADVMLAGNRHGCVPCLG